MLWTVSADKHQQNVHYAVYRIFEYCGEKDSLDEHKFYTDLCRCTLKRGESSFLEIYSVTFPKRFSVLISLVLIFHPTCLMITAELILKYLILINPIPYID